MFRRPRETEPDYLSVELNTILQPLTVIPWGAIAMGYLGVPICIGATMFVVQDDDYTAAIEKLNSAGFVQTVPNRTPLPEIMERHPNPQKMLEEINAGYIRLDRSCAVFDYPPGHSAGKGTQLYLFPNSFTHFSLQEIRQSSNKVNDTEIIKQFDTYGNLHYPLEAALVESFIKAAIDEEKDIGFSAWGMSLEAWVAMMRGYLEVNNDILDHFLDEQAVNWYSTKFGRIYEAKFGPRDRRISKRLGSGKEIPIDMREILFNGGLYSARCKAKFPIPEGSTRPQVSVISAALRDVPEGHHTRSITWLRDMAETLNSFGKHWLEI